MTEYTNILIRQLLSESDTKFRALYRSYAESPTKDTWEPFYHYFRKTTIVALHEDVLRLIPKLEAIGIYINDDVVRSAKAHSLGFMHDTVASPHFTDLQKAVKTPSQKSFIYSAFGYNNYMGPVGPRHQEHGGHTLRGVIGLYYLPNGTTYYNVSVGGTGTRHNKTVSGIVDKISKVIVSLLKTSFKEHRAVIAEVARGV